MSEPFVRLSVEGRPATFATAHELPWKQAVADAVTAAGVSPPEEGRFSVRIEFRTPAPQNPNARWDIDNLVKPTLDAMGGVFGMRRWKGPEQAADDRVDHIDARKREVGPEEMPGASIEVWLEERADTSPPVEAP